MSRFTWLSAAALTIALGAAMPAAAQEAEAPPAQAEQQAAFTDAQIGAFAAASQEIDPISRRIANATPEERTEGAIEIRAILTRHSLEADTYNAIATQAQNDAGLQARIVAALPTAQPAGDETPPPEPE